MDNNILVQNLCKQFEDFSLDNVSFKVPKGRIVGFIGENGAGKSTTINLILNELSKDSGQIQVFGIDHTIPTVKENIGVVFDEMYIIRKLKQKNTCLRIIVGMKKCGQVTYEKQLQAALEEEKVEL